MLLAIILIIIITLIFNFLNHLLKIEFCPICIGVSGTWIFLTIGIMSGILSESYKLPILMLMGGTVVGIAFQGEKKFSFAKNNIWFWKIPAIIIGFIIFYIFFLKMNWLTFFLELILLIILSYLFFIKSKKDSEVITDKEKKIKKLEKLLKGCC